MACKLNQASADDSRTPRQNFVHVSPQTRNTERKNRFAKNSKWRIVPGHATSRNLIHARGVPTRVRSREEFQLKLKLRPPFEKNRRPPQPANRPHI